MDEVIMTETHYPTASELEDLYVMIENGQIPELDWKSPGRISPSSENAQGFTSNESGFSSTTNVTPGPSSAGANNTTSNETSKNDFDFSDDVAQPMMRVRTQNSTPKSAKKKTANFAGVMEVLKKKNAESSS